VYVFRLVVELVLVPVLFLLAGLLVVSQLKEEYKPVERLVSNATALFGAGVFAYAGYSIYSDWSSFAKVETAKDFLVPLALSLLFMPFIYFGICISRMSASSPAYSFTSRTQS
jgi:hypothetical protein